MFSKFSHLFLGMGSNNFTFLLKTLSLSMVSTLEALPVVIDSEDTDVYVQAAYVAHKVPGDLLIKGKNRFVNCRSLVDESISNIIINTH